MYMTNIHDKLSLSWRWIQDTLMKAGAFTVPLFR